MDTESFTLLLLLVALIGVVSILAVAGWMALQFARVILLYDAGDGQVVGEVVGPVVDLSPGLPGPPGHLPGPPGQLSDPSTTPDPSTMFDSYRITDPTDWTVPEPGRPKVVRIEPGESLVP